MASRGCISGRARFTKRPSFRSPWERTRELGGWGWRKPNIWRLGTVKFHVPFHFTWQIAGVCALQTSDRHPLTVFQMHPKGNRQVGCVDSILLIVVPKSGHETFFLVFSFLWPSLISSLLFFLSFLHFWVTSCLFSSNFQESVNTWQLEVSVKQCSSELDANGKLGFQGLFCC